LSSYVSVKLENSLEKVYQTEKEK